MSRVQAVLFPVSWETSACRKWLKDHSLKPIKRVHKSAKYKRYRISEPDGAVRPKTLKNGVKVLLRVSKGSGLFSRTSAPPAYRAFLEKYGQWTVDKMTCCRTPIINAIDKFANIITLGGWESAKKRYGYDKMFHLYCFMTLTDPVGKGSIEIMTQKNEVLEMRMKRSSDESSSSKSMYAGAPGKKLKDIIDRVSSKQGTAFYLYDAFNSSGGGNCQNYVWGLVEACGLGTAALSTFVNQKVENLLPNLFKKAARAVTDTAAAVDTILHGKGSTSFPRYVMHNGS